MSHFKFFAISLIVLIGSSYLGYKYNDSFNHPEKVGKEVINLYKDYTK